MRTLVCGPMAIGALILFIGNAHAQQTDVTGGRLQRRNAFDRLFVESPVAAIPAHALIHDVPDLYAVQQPAAPHPEPEHTGFAALVFETGKDFKAFPRRRSTWVILGIGAAAAAIAHPADDEVNERLVSSGAAGKYLAPGKWIGAVYVQAGVAVGLYVVGRYVLPHTEGEPRTNKVSHLGFDLLRGVIVSQALTQAIKITVRRDRPTGECCAFPSGHASVTFATASILERHLGYRGAWPTFAIAAYVATSRLQDNRHFLSDVLLGGALGMATGWTVVGRHGRSSYAFMPVPVRGGVMLAITHTPPLQLPRQHRKEAAGTVGIASVPCH